MKNSFIKLIIIQIFSIILFLKKYESKNISNINNSVYKPDDKIDKISGDILASISYLIFSNLTILKEILDKNIGELDKICNIPFFEFILNKRYFLNTIATKLFDNGMTSNLLEYENECIDGNDFYLLISLNHSFSNIYQNIDEYNNQNILFIETLIRERELCLWRNCSVPNLAMQIIFHYIKPNIENMLSLESINIEGINLKYNGTTLYEEEYNDHKDYKNILII